MGKRSRKLSILYISVSVLFVVDRLLKWYAVNQLDEEGRFLIPDVTGLLLERNEGIAYGISINPTVLTISISFIIVALLIFLFRALKSGSVVTVAALLVLSAGAVSNFIDRLVYGYVVDMLVLTSWPVFNIADMLIMTGAGWLVVSVYSKEKRLVNK